VFDEKKPEVENISNTYIAVFLLNKLEECPHVGPPEVVMSPETSEEAPSEQPLEVVLANVLKIVGILFLVNSVSLIKPMLQRQNRCRSGKKPRYFSC
jgi:hypothetical protein